jgi:hypothetical protein
VTGEQIPLWEATAQFYQQRGCAREFVDEGLDPERYAYSTIRRLEDMASGDDGEVEREDMLDDLDLSIRHERISALCYTA